MKNREKILRAVREKGNLDSEVEGMDLVGLRQIHQILFEEAIRAGRMKFEANFSIDVLRRKIDNTFGHMQKNMCSSPIVYCSRNSCDSYDRDCVAKKIRDQINRITLEVLNPTSKA